ncbi:sulfite reductase subunit alpha [Rhodopseudomonas palustris]|uniref:sulfite reductase subunit alpha n=1 Tax=Rhodopseudomonas palustris TaxID=1076 RepID=UPI002ACDAB8F|nr:sulfite reductase subunit alpha [Rhodopseudomonas palustris]WQG99958.1 sulfite reductase subunit alpha [Rhodopseudomonas palustris]
MSQNMPPPIPTLIPDTAPFSEEQRAWLNGFFAGLVSLDGSGVTALSSEQAAALLGNGPAPGAAADDGGAPWHDQTLPIAERMQLAESKPLRWKLMAAMAQQDCGQCGYDCKNYSAAIFEGKEPRLNLCAPGGKDTARMVKTLAEQIGSAPKLDSAPPLAVDAAAAAALPPRGTSRDNPATAKVLSRRKLNKDGSEKETWHIEFELEEGLSYEAGDSFGLFPGNDPALVDLVLQALRAPAEFPIGERSLRAVLTDSVSLSPAPDMLFQLISYITGGDKRKKARALANGEDPDGDAATLDVLAALEKFPGIRPDPEAFVEALDPLQPRLYSISSSPKTIPGRLSLTVDCVRYTIGKRQRLGVCSTGLAERVTPGDSVRVYVQKAHNFALPADPAQPIIMIGPGTGVAPFRAFLHERQAIAAPGKNWLFFGHQRSACDFFYDDELNAMKRSGLLTRLSLAWSRDSGEKIYVQDRMREVGRDLWSWLTEGATIYVCGDAQRMAKDVELALVDIVAQHGARSAAEATAFVSELKKQGRYQQDVY